MCSQRYEVLEGRSDKIEQKVYVFMKTFISGNKAMMKVMIRAAGTVVAGLLLTPVLLIFSK